MKASGAIQRCQGCEEACGGSQRRLGCLEGICLRRVEATGARRHLCDMDGLCSPE